MSDSIQNLHSLTTTTKTFGLPWSDYNDGLTYRDTVPSSDSDMTLIEYYSSKHKNSAPLQGWLQRIKNGQIAIDGIVITDPNTNIRVRSEIVYHRLPWKEPDAPYLLEVLYEDDNMIVLNKPSGLQVLPGGLFHQRTVLTQLQWRANKQSSSSARLESQPVPVHRLGRGTSGILLCAKTKIAKTRLAAYFADGTSIVGGNSYLYMHGSTKMELSTVRKISKIYRALVVGIVDKDEISLATDKINVPILSICASFDNVELPLGEWTDNAYQIVIKQPIGMMQYPGVAKGLYVASPSGKPALSKVVVLERDVERNHTLVQVEIQSGRPHQIRIHLAFIGNPLFGDPLYVTGGQPKCFDSEFIDESFSQDGGYQRPVNPVPGDCGYYLHAHQLVLTHPITNEVLKITAPLPSVLQTKLEAAGR